MNKELYYALVNIIDYIATHTINYKDHLRLHDCINYLSAITGDEPEDVADANNVSSYLEDGYIGWDEVIEAFRVAWKKDERLPGGLDLVKTSEIPTEREYYYYGEWRKGNKYGVHSES